MTSRFARIALAVSSIVAVSLPASAQTTHVVNQSGFSFQPQNITIKVGDTVQWVHSQGDHTVTSGTGASGSGALFNSLLTPAVPTFSFTFGAAFVAANPMPGGVYDYHCIPHLFFGMIGSVKVVDCGWTNLGFAKAGVLGSPSLVGDGCLAAGEQVSLSLSNATPSSTTVLFLGIGASNPTPFFGGLLAPFPPVTTLVLPTNPAGEVNLSFTVPASIVPGINVLFQYAIADPSASLGVALSNAVERSS